MEKFSLVPSFAGDDAPSPDKTPALTPDGLQSLLSDTDAPSPKETADAPAPADPPLSYPASGPTHSPDAMLNLLSAHEKALAKIRGKR